MKLIWIVILAVLFSGLGGAVLDIRNFGAKGDGVTDDTAAFARLEEKMNQLEEPCDVVIPAGVYMVNPLMTPLRKIGSSNALRRKCLIELKKDCSNVTGSGLIKIIPGVDYTAGMKNGEEWYWAVVLISANHCTVDGLHFSGNGTGTLRGYIAKQPNLRWEGVSALGPGDGNNYHIGNRVINSYITQGGGQAIAMQHQKQAQISGNVVEDSSGMGFSRSDDSILSNNISIRSHDAPYVANGNCNNILISGNIARDTTNGSGIDVVGCRNVVISGNVIEGAAAWAVLVGYSVQQKKGCDNILIIGNIFRRNCRSVDTPFNGEIMIGRPWGESPEPISNVTVSNNQFEIDGTHGDDKGAFVTIGYHAENVQINNNVICGTPNRNGVILSVNCPVRDLLVSDNVWTGKTPVKFGSAPETSSVFYGQNQGVQQ